MQTENEIRHGRSVVYALTAHLAFVTKYRRGAITDRVREHLQTTFVAVMADFGGLLLEMDGEDDHVHLLVSFTPKHSLSTLVNSLKGVSARLLRKQGFPEVTQKLWGSHFWAPSYFVSTTGGASIATVRRYIQDQRLPAKRRPKGSPSSRP